MSTRFSRHSSLPVFIAGIAAGIALLAGCERAAPPAPAAAEASAIVGAIDGKRALSFLYGPFDDKLEATVWVVNGASDGSPASAALENGDEALVSVLLARAVKEGDDERFYLGVAMVPYRSEDEGAFDCETCAPVAGAAVFVKRGDRWVVEAHDPFIATVEGGTIAARFGAQTAAENGGNCSNDAKDGSGLEPCHKYALTIAFEPGPLPQHYDIHLRPSDPTWQYDHRGGSGEKLLRFDGQRYVAATGACALSPIPVNRSCDRRTP
jgi:hypothetical protein